LLRGREQLEVFIAEKLVFGRQVGGTGVEPVTSCL
jgi:hypothetical protein